MYLYNGQHRSILARFRSGILPLGVFKTFLGNLDYVQYVLVMP